MVSWGSGAAPASSGAAGPAGAEPVRRLVLLRHAKAEPATTSDDALRPLALRGREQSARVGEALADGGLLPDLVIVSTALRTRQTWDLASGALGHGPRGDGRDVAVTYSEELYQANVRDVLAILHGLDEAVRTVLVVGHEPTMASTASFLAGPASDDVALAQVRVGVPTATYSVLEAPAAEPWTAWDRSTAVLTLVTRPA